MESAKATVLCSIANLIGKLSEILVNNTTCRFSHTSLKETIDKLTIYLIEETRRLQ